MINQHLYIHQKSKEIIILNKQPQPELIYNKMQQTQQTG